MKRLNNYQFPVEITDEQAFEMGLVPISEIADISECDNPNSQRMSSDTRDRILWLDHDITQDADGIIMRHIMYWNQVDNGVPIEERKPIYIFINSNGGEISAAMALYDLIMLSKTPVYGIDVGYAFSGAFIVLLACHHRIATPHSWGMVHRGSSESSYSDHLSAHNSMKQWDAQVRDMEDIVSARTDIPREDVEKYMLTDSFFSASDMLKLGIVDEIATSIYDMVRLEKNNDQK